MGSSSWVEKLLRQKCVPKSILPPNAHQMSLRWGRGRRKRIFKNAIWHQIWTAQSSLPPELKLEWRTLILQRLRCFPSRLRKLFSSESHAGFSHCAAAPVSFTHWKNNIQAQTRIFNLSFEELCAVYSMNTEKKVVEMLRQFKATTWSVMHGNLMKRVWSLRGQVLTVSWITQVQ